MNGLSQRGAPRRAVFWRLAAFTILASGIWVVVVRGQAFSTYYVDGSCTSSGNGTTTTCGANGPFRTIKAAVDNPSLAAGDTIKVKVTGTPYSESTITTHVAGTSAAPITVTRYDGDTSRPVWARSSSITMLNANHAYWVFDNIEFRATAASSDIVQVRGTNATFRNCVLFGGGYALNIADTGDNLTVDGCTFDSNGNNAKHSISSGRIGTTGTYTLTGVVIRNSTFQNSVGEDYIQWLETSGACRIATVTGLIENNTFTKSAIQAENAIDVKTMALQNDPLVIQNNTITGWNGNGSPGKAVVVQHCPDYVYVNNNRIDNTPGGTCTNNCRCIEMSVSTGAGTPPVTGLEVIGNTLLRCTAAIHLGDGTTSDNEISGIKIYNNTAAKIRAGGEFLGVETNILAGEIRNNLWDGTATTAAALDCVGSAYSVTGLIASHNGWFGSASQQGSCSADCTGTICSPNDKVGTTPGFVDWTNDDYTLAAGSPAIDAGTPVGLPYNGTAPDLGAKETGGPPPPADTTPPTGVGNVSPSNGATGASLTPTLTAVTVSDATPPSSYFFELYQGNACTGTPVQTRAYATSTSWSPTALQANTTYAWRNKARDSAATPNESAFGSCWTFTTLQLAPATTPTSLISTGETWKYFKGTVDPNAAWKNVSFDDSAWLNGPMGIGYGDGDDATVLNDMAGNYLTVYARKNFTVNDPATVTGLTLNVDYDDGFVAYLNGQEVARASMPSGTPTRTTKATSHEAGTPENFNLSTAINLLTAGTNVLAIEVHNTSISSSDLSLIPALVATVSTPPDTTPPAAVNDLRAQ